MAVELGPHQIKAMREMHNGSVLKGGVGTGKSRTALAYFVIQECEGGLKVNDKGEYHPMRKPRDLYIITTAKKRDDVDWEKEAATFAISSDPTSSHSGVRMVVDSWNNIMNYTHVENAFFIFDEQRLVGSGAWVKAFLRIAQANHWVMLSATPGDTWMDYIPVFIANGFYKNRTDFCREHVVWQRFTKFPKVDRYVETRKLERLRAKILVEMPYERHTTRHILNTIVGYDEELFKKVTKDRWHVYEDRPLRDVSELFAVMRKVVNTDVSRLAAIMELLEKHPALIIFYNYNYELEMLRMLANTLSYPMGEWNGQKHEDLPDGDRWMYLVQYTAGAEGWNCVRTNAIAFWSLNYSWRVMEQSKGRIDRLNTPFKDLFYYILRSGSAIDKAIVKSLGVKKTFNERSYARELGISSDAFQSKDLSEGDQAGRAA